MPLPATCSDQRSPRYCSTSQLALLSRHSRMVHVTTPPSNKGLIVFQIKAFIDTRHISQFHRATELSSSSCASHVSHSLAPELSRARYHCTLGSTNIKIMMRQAWSYLNMCITGLVAKSHHSFRISSVIAYLNSAAAIILNLTNDMVQLRGSVWMSARYCFSYTNWNSVDKCN